MISVTALKEMYPDVLQAEHHKGKGQSYCIGGALLAVVSKVERIPLGLASFSTFPVPIVLARIIRNVNPRLSKDAAFAAAAKVIHLNDNGEFQRAWDALLWALTEGY